MDSLLKLALEVSKEYAIWKLTLDSLFRLKISKEYEEDEKSEN